MSVNSTYEFTNGWFRGNVFGSGMVVNIPEIWNSVLERRDISRVLEIGSYEGQSACYLIKRLGTRGGSLTCVDTWAGSAEHTSKIDMDQVERRFDANTQLALSEISDVSVELIKIKERSVTALTQIIHADIEFDLVYIDGSHNSQDVLFDLVMSFQLLKIGGLIICDDYLWDYGYRLTNDINSCPKPAIDAFCSIFNSSVRILRGFPIYQLYLEKYKN